VTVYTIIGIACWSLFFRIHWKLLHFTLLLSAAELILTIESFLRRGEWVCVIQLMWTNSMGTIHARWRKSSLLWDCLGLNNLILRKEGWFRVLLGITWFCFDYLWHLRMLQLVIHKKRLWDCNLLWHGIIQLMCWCLTRKNIRHILDRGILGKNHRRIHVFRSRQARRGWIWWGVIKKSCGIRIGELS